jgi:hypothetical protein
MLDPQDFLKVKQLFNFNIVKNQFDMLLSILPSIFSTFFLVDFNVIFIHFFA